MRDPTDLSRWERGIAMDSHGHTNKYNVAAQTRSSHRAHAAAPTAAKEATAAQAAAPAADESATSGQTVAPIAARRPRLEQLDVASRRLES